jgi:hypothetical protein
VWKSINLDVLVTCIKLDEHGEIAQPDQLTQKEVSDLHLRNDIFNQKIGISKREVITYRSMDCYIGIKSLILI